MVLLHVSGITVIDMCSQVNELKQPATLVLVLCKICVVLSKDKQAFDWLIFGLIVKDFKYNSFSAKYNMAENRTRRFSILPTYMLYL